MPDGNKILEHDCHRSAFARLRSPPQPRAFCERERADSKGHPTQALIALVRGRIDLVWIILRNGLSSRPGLPLGIFMAILLGLWVNGARE